MTKFLYVKWRETETLINVDHIIRVYKLESGKAAFVMTDGEMIYTETEFYSLVQNLT